MGPIDRLDDTRPASVLIVGGGLAGLMTAAALRSAGFDGSVTLIGKEPHRPYDRPPLSKQLLDQVEPVWLEEDLGLSLGDLVDDYRPGVAATGVVPGEWTVTTANGAISAEAVVIAAGADPVLPSELGSGLVLRTIDDAAALRPVIGRHGRLVIVGAGWIGCELASVAADAGCAVAVIDRAEAPLSVVGAPLSGLVTGWMSDAGVDFRPGRIARRIENGRLTVSGPDGEEVLPADEVLIALGARPATDWLAGAVPLQPDGSLLVDASHRVVGAPAGLYAVGDCATRISERFGLVPGGHWDGALRDPGRVAAAITGTAPAEAADPAPYVFSTQFGHDLILVGRPGSGRPVVLAQDPGISAVWADGEDPDAAVHGVLLVDRPRQAAAARKLLRTAPTLSTVDRLR